MIEFLQIAGPRMDELADRFAANHEAAERLKFEAYAAATDVTPVELIGMLLRSAVAAMAAAIVAGSRNLDIPEAQLRDFAIAAIDEQLASDHPLKERAR